MLIWKEGISVRIDDLGLGFNRELFNHYKVLQPQIDNLNLIRSQLVDSLGGLDKWSRGLNLSYLNMENSYSQLLLQTRRRRTTELPGIATALEEFQSITSVLRQSISYSGMEKALESFRSPIFATGNYETLSNTIAGLSRIFDDDFKNQLENTINSLNVIYSENADFMDDMWDSITEEDFEGCTIDGQGNLVCDSGIVTTEEAQRTILEAIADLIDKVNNSWIEFEKKHKVAIFLLRMYIGICTALGKPTTQPLVSVTQKAISTANGYADKYYVSEECVRVYTNPNSKSQVIYRVSYGETVISEENAKGWIKVSIAAGDEVYQGWIAKRNLISYEKAKFHKDELEHEIE